VFDTTTEAGKRAEVRLREEEISWMTTVRSDGQPQTVPVWFLWDDEGFLIYSQPTRQKPKKLIPEPPRRTEPELQRSWRRRRAP
jgi:PPOX class probable F420-dependent enzyme